MLKQRQALNKLLFFTFLLAVLCYSTTAFGEPLVVKHTTHSAYLAKAQKPSPESLCLIGMGNKTHKAFNDIEIDNAQTATIIDISSRYQKIDLSDYSYFPCHKEKIRIIAANKVHWLSGEVRVYPIL